MSIGKSPFSVESYIYSFVILYIIDFNTLVEAEVDPQVNAENLIARSSLMRKREIDCPKWIQLIYTFQRNAPDALIQFKTNIYPHGNLAPIL